jgi:phosphoglycerol transferase
MQVKRFDAALAAVPVWARPLLFAAILATTVLAIAWKTLHLSTYDLRVPITYHEIDNVIMAMYIKAVVQDGWPTAISHLSAPFSYAGAAFPLLTSVDWAIIKVMSLFSHEPGLLLNAFWLFTAVASALSFAYAAYQIGVRPLLAFAGGVLYAYLPFALLRNVHHLNLVYYLVPLLCLLAVVIASAGQGVRDRRQATRIGLVACALQGFNYVYFSFFAVLLFMFAAIIALRRDRIRALGLPMLAASIVTVATAINLIPAWQSWQQDGKPVDMGYKNAAEAEVYGAKLRKMIMPHPDNAFTPLGWLARKNAEANFPLENENTTARLGPFGAAGLLLVLIVLMRRQVRPEIEPPLGTVPSLSLAVFLLITVGGFGALINLATVPDIRAYGRFSVYMSFFVMVAAALWMGNQRGKWRHASLAAALVLAVFSLYDQLLDTRYIVAAMKKNVAAANDERGAVERMEAVLPRGTAVLELPFTGYPPISVHHTMLSYDHGKPYLWSQHLRWSWPSFSQRHRAWQTRMEGQQGSKLVDAAVLSGFGAIWVDSHAYPDGGAAVLDQLASAGAKPIDTASKRYRALDLSAAATALKGTLPGEEFQRRAAALLGKNLFMEWKAGFYPEERSAEGRPFHWAMRKADLVVRNGEPAPVQACLRFDVASPTSGVITLSGLGDPLSITAQVQPKHLDIPVRFEAGETKRLQFATNADAMAVPGDNRQLHFYVMSYSIEAAGDPAACQSR